MASTLWQTVETSVLSMAPGKVVRLWVLTELCTDNSFAAPPLLRSIPPILQGKRSSPASVQLRHWLPSCGRPQGRISPSSGQGWASEENGTLLGKPWQQLGAAVTQRPESAANPALSHPTAPRPTSCSNGHMKSRIARSYLSPLLQTHIWKSLHLWIIMTINQFWKQWFNLRCERLSSQTLQAASSYSVIAAAATNSAKERCCSLRDEILLRKALVHWSATRNGMPALQPPPKQGHCAHFAPHSLERPWHISIGKPCKHTHMHTHGFPKTVT